MTDNTLSEYVVNRTIETGAVIACAASDMTTQDILVFYYPEAAASDIRLYVTDDTTVDNSDYSKYTQLSANALPLFNGYLEKMAISSEIEKWIIVTFELNGDVKISNPIRTRHISKPTIWNDNVTINQSTSGMPEFTWLDNAFGDNAIYFQVITNFQDDLLSGTYTYENQFQYYNTSNVVLNITIQTPPVLTFDESYSFTLMDVSIDNWVNYVIQKTFVAQ